MSKKFTFVASLILFFVSIHVFGQDTKNSQSNQSNAFDVKKSDNTSTSKVEPQAGAILIYHNNSPSNAQQFDFTWSLEAYSNEDAVKSIVSKLSSNSYFKNVSTIESGIENKKFIQFTLTGKYEEEKVFNAFATAGVLYKRALDQSGTEKIK